MVDITTRTNAVVTSLSGEEKVKALVPFEHEMVIAKQITAEVFVGVLLGKYEKEKNNDTEDITDNWQIV